MKRFLFFSFFFFFFFFSDDDDDNGDDNNDDDDGDDDDDDDDDDDNGCRDADCIKCVASKNTGSQKKSKKREPATLNIFNT